jgi:hypothetical protein
VSGAVVGSCGSASASASASSAVSAAPACPGSFMSDGSCAGAEPLPPETSIISSGEPWATLSPTLTLSSCTTPANGAGTSIVALSDSSVTSGSSSETVSPAETSTSITGTSSKSPMSGTSTSFTSATEPPRRS